MDVLIEGAPLSLDRCVAAETVSAAGRDSRVAKPVREDALVARMRSLVAPHVITGAAELGDSSARHS